VNRTEFSVFFHETTRGNIFASHFYSKYSSSLGVKGLRSIIFLKINSIYTDEYLIKFDQLQLKKYIFRCYYQLMGQFCFKFKTNNKQGGSPVILKQDIPK